MCGEDITSEKNKANLMETPPRVWGRRPLDRVKNLFNRNTPTCVGKTRSPGVRLRVWRNTPTCVGKTKANLMETPPRETPPRVWGRLINNGESGVIQGNTPTCVGKTLNDH